MLVLLILVGFAQFLEGPADEAPHAVVSTGGILVVMAIGQVILVVGHSHGRNGEAGWK